MKDKKKLTYMLIAGSLMVWGLVFYKVFSYIGGSDGSTLRTNTSTTIPAVAEKQEVYTLLLDYRDPFLGRTETGIGNGEGNGLPVKKKKIKVIKEPEKPIDVSFISYAGMITNPTTKRKVALVTIKGKQSMVSEGEILEEVTFIKNYKDSIQVSYLGKLAYVKRY